MPGYIGRAEIEAAGGAISRNVYSGNGSTTSFGPLDQQPFNEEETVVTINGIVQHDSSYAIVIDYVNFALAPESGDDIEVKVFSTSRVPAEGVNNANIQDESITISKLSTIDIMTSNDKLDRFLIPSKRRFGYPANLQYDTTNRNSWENTCVEFTITNKTLTLGTAITGDELEAVIIGSNFFNLDYDTGTVVVYIDGAGNKTTLTAPIVINGDNILKIKYLAPDYVIVESSNIPTLVATNGWTNLGGGMILQWGTSTVIGNGSSGILFPIVFPNLCLNVTSTPVGFSSGGGTGDYWGVNNIQTNGFTQANAYDGGQSLCFQAIGY